MCLYGVTLRVYPRSNRPLDLVAQLAEHWTSKTKVASSIPTGSRADFSSQTQ